MSYMKQILLMLFVMALAACHTNSTTYRILAEIDTLMYSMPDSALTRLEMIPPERIKSKKQQAYYSLLLSQAYDKNYIDIADDSLIMVAYNYYNRPANRDVNKQALTCYYRGKVQLNSEDLPTAITSFLEAIQYGEITNDNYLLGLSHTQLGIAYDSQELFSQATDHYHQASESFSLANLPRHKIQSLLKIGEVYNCCQDFNNALAYYHQAEALAIDINDTLFLMQIGRNVSSTYLLMGNIEGAKTALLDTYTKYNYGVVPKSHSDLVLLGSIYSQEDKRDSARYYLKQALGKGNVYNMAAIEYELHELHLKDKNINLSMQHLKKYYTLVDSLYISNLQHNIFEIEKKYETTQLEYENYKHRTTKRYIVIGVIIGIVLICGILIRLFRRIRNRDAQIKAYLLALSEADNSMHTILNHANETENKLMKMLEKRFSILSKYYEIAYSWQIRPERAEKKITELLSLESIENDCFVILRDIVEGRHNGLIDKMRKSRPELSENDLNLLCLIVCKFSAQQMSAVYNASSLQTIYTKKYRLAQKLNLHRDETLDTFIVAHITTN